VSVGCGPDDGAGAGDEDAALCLAGQALVAEFFDRVDRGVLDDAVGLYAADAVFLGAQGRSAIRETMVRGLAPNADKRTRHVVGNVRSYPDGGVLVVRYTALAYTLDGPGPYAARSVLDQEMCMRRGPDGRLQIVEHRIFGDVPAGHAPESASLDP
jgi:ketosteroid isomerase-like protein